MKYLPSHLGPNRIKMNAKDVENPEELGGRGLLGARPVMLKSHLFSLQTWRVSHSAADGEGLQGQSWI